MKFAQLAFEEYRVMSVGVKTKFYPVDTDILGGGIGTNLWYHGSSGNTSQIPTTSTFMDLKEHPNVVLQNVGGGGQYARPKACMHMIRPRKLVPDMGSYIATSLTGTTTNNASPPFFTGPVGPADIVQIWLTTANPNGFVGGETILGYMEVTLYVNVHFWGRKTFTQ